MKDRTLLRIALLTSVVGMGILLFYGAGIEMADTPINRLQNISDSSKVSISGKIVSVSSRGSLTSITLAQQCTAEIVLFDGVAGIAEGDSVRVTGTVKDYNGKKEIIATKIAKKT